MSLTKRFNDAPIITELTTLSNGQKFRVYNQSNDITVHIISLGIQSGLSVPSNWVITVKCLMVDLKSQKKSEYSMTLKKFVTILSESGVKVDLESVSI